MEHHIFFWEMGISKDVDVKFQYTLYLNFDVDVLKYAFFQWIVANAGATLRTKRGFVTLSVQIFLKIHFLELEKNAFREDLCLRI